MFQLLQLLTSKGALSGPVQNTVPASSLASFQLAAMLILITKGIQPKHTHTYSQVLHSVHVPQGEFTS